MQSETQIERNSFEKTMIIDPKKPYPLAHDWSVWYYEDKTTHFPKTQDEYQKNLRKVGTFNTVQTFWGLYNALPNITYLRQSAVYHFHWADAVPLREDIIHKDGGALVLRLHEESAIYVWERLCMGLVGETINQHIGKTLGLLGLSIKKRNIPQRIYQIDCWLQDTEDFPRMESYIEKHFHEHEFLEIYFSVHKDHCAFNAKKLRKSGKLGK